ncbi:MAG: hypothetical protein KatS3mg104_0282 [Phycisphaerae bacterium]|nr:MAG: hypothetical protein KatS3mg104_0282 [Phycisphaerae bacterium]
MGLKRWIGKNTYPTVQETGNSMSLIPDEVQNSGATPATPRMIHDPKLVWRWFWGLSIGLLGFYLLLQNPYWVPGGDSDFYVAIARNLVQEGKYEYNGLPVAISPPGWPWVMALVLQVSPYFLSLKLLAMLFMWGSLLIGYFIALRFVPPRIAALSVALAGILMPVYSLTYFLHSEGLYCLLSAAALLLVFRLRESPDRWVERIGLILLCVAIPFVRWAGVFQMLPLVAVLLSGRWSRSNQSRQWWTAIFCILAIISTWLGTRYSLELTAEQLQAIKDAGGSSVMEEEVSEVPSDAASVELIPITAKGETSVIEEYAQRVIRSGKWFSWLLWHPTRFAGPLNKWLDSTVSLIGWLVIVLLGWMAVRRLIKGELLWFSLALYCGGLCLNWPNPNARYFVPVAGLIILGTLLAIRDLGQVLDHKPIDWSKWIRRGFVYSIILCNVALYGVDVLVMRSSNFYDTFEAGQHRDLVNIAHYLLNLPPEPDRTKVSEKEFWAFAPYRPRDGAIMINERYENLDRVRFSKAGMRAMVLLTDLNIKPLDKGLSKFTSPSDPATSESGKRFPTRMIRTVRRLKVDWVLIQSPAVPWRVWHFRIPLEWYRMFSRYPDRPPSGGWTLYRYNPNEGDLLPQPVPAVDGWPKRVPGM